jgi:hypothetical protein
MTRAIGFHYTQQSGQICSNPYRRADEVDQVCKKLFNYEPFQQLMGTKQIDSSQISSISAETAKHTEGAVLRVKTELGTFHSFTIKQGTDKTIRQAAQFLMGSKAPQFPKPARALQQPPAAQAERVPQQARAPQVRKQDSDSDEDEFFDAQEPQAAPAPQQQPQAEQARAPQVREQDSDSDDDEFFDAQEPQVAPALWQQPQDQQLPVLNAMSEARGDFMRQLQEFSTRFDTRFDTIVQRLLQAQMQQLAAASEERTQVLNRYERLVEQGERERNALLQLIEQQPQRREPQNLELNNDVHLPQQVLSESDEEEPQIIAPAPQRFVVAQRPREQNQRSVLPFALPLLVHLGYFLLRSTESIEPPVIIEDAPVRVGAPELERQRESFPDILSPLVFLAAQVLTRRPRGRPALGLLQRALRELFSEK